MDGIVDNILQLVIIGEGVWPIDTSLPSPDAPTAWDQVSRAASRFQERYKAAEEAAVKAEEALAAARAAMGRGWAQQGRYDECREELDEVNGRLAARNVAGAGDDAVGYDDEADAENALYGAEDAVLDAVLAYEPGQVAELVGSGRFSWQEVDNIVANYAAQALMEDDECAAGGAWNTLVEAKRQGGMCGHAVLASAACAVSDREEFEPALGDEAVWESHGNDENDGQDTL